MEEGDFDVMHQKLDFYGLNFYNGLYDNMEEIRKREEILKAGGNYQDRPEQHPEALRRCAAYGGGKISCGYSDLHHRERSSPGGRPDGRSCSTIRKESIM